MKSDSDSILDILGNDTRRKILSSLADEPMYFNQLAKEVDIGQQAMLRHLDSLEKAGLIETYSEKSDFGAPNRKYYRLSSAFTLTVSLSEDDFLVSHQKIEDSPNREFKKKSRKLEESASEEIGATVSLLQESLHEVNIEISKMESQLSALRARRQNILRRLHEIGIERFEDDERKILYMLVRESPKSFSELSDLLDEKESVLKELLVRMRSKMQGQSDLFDLLDEL
jgi:ArsR family transcriptional regulator